jgi:hypothetical protein
LQLGRLHDRAGAKRGLIPAGSALMALMPSSVGNAMWLPIAAETADAIKPVRLLQ